MSSSPVVTRSVGRQITLLSGGGIKIMDNHGKTVEVDLKADDSGTAVCGGTRIDFDSEAKVEEIISLAREVEAQPEHRLVVNGQPKGGVTIRKGTNVTSFGGPGYGSGTLVMGSNTTIIGRKRK